MKRPPGLWILLSAGVLWLCLQDVYGIRATALIFGKSTTSTTTETSTSPVAEDRIDSECDSDDAALSCNSTTDSNSTTPILTGNPQIDYLVDPNLPKELNGYNLSDYPFYGRVPNEKFEFKCDGLHDGFYASIPHKCQVYHQCLFGTRYDFLCANYTAFDQKTFICQFVSVVDCENSKNFWHRNDELYKATTTTAAPNLRAAIYTTAPPNGADSGQGRRRPLKRRPQVEYYDDEYYDDEYYDERPRSNRGRMRPRARPRPRPAYEDDEAYEDERYESRRSNNRKRPYRDRRKNKDRRRPAEYDEDEEVDDRFEDEDFVDAPKRSKSQTKRPQEEEKPKRKPQRKPNRRPVYDEEYEDDDLPQADDSRTYEDRPKKNKFRKEESTSSDGRPIIKSSTGTIYDRPRVAPRINLPVPKNAADKFSYKTLGGGGGKTTTTTTVAASPAEEEEYEEVEEPPKRKNRRPVKEKPKKDSNDNQQSASRPSRRKPQREEEVAEVEVEVEKTTPKAKYSSGINRYQRKRPKPIIHEEEEYDDDKEDTIQEEVQERRPSQKYESKRTSTTTTTTTTSTTTTTTEASKREPQMRIIKRPFLPSRGGDPYSPRGLKPVGLKAVEPQEYENESEESDAEKQPIVQEEYIEEPRPNKIFKPSPVIVKVPVRQQFSSPTAEAQEFIDLEPTRLQNYKSNPRTTQRPKLIEKNPIYDEYDVTLNDALNPTLSNLPVRAFPTGFSSPGGGDYYSRQRYVLEPVINQNNYALQNNKVVRSSQNQQRYETLPQRQTQAIYSRY